MDHYLIVAKDVNFHFEPSYLMFDLLIIEISTCQ